MKLLPTSPLLVLCSLPAWVHSATLYCTTVSDLNTALTAVQAGDEIVLAPGGLFFSDGVAISGTGAYYASYADGTEDEPIMLRSEDPSNPATLSGSNAGSKTGLRIFGAFWTVQDLIVTNAQKGIVFDNAPFGQVINCTVSSVNG